MAEPRIPLAERFWAKVQKTDYCWNWIGAKDSLGYAQIKIASTKRLVHRVAWELTYGKIPDGLHVLHDCDNRCCVKPDHLFLGTHRDNMRDRDIKGRQAKGSRSGMAKLTEADVLTIRSRSTNKVSQRALSRQYGVSHTTIQDILHRRIWRHL